MTLAEILMNSKKSDQEKKQMLNPDYSFIDLLSEVDKKISVRKVTSPLTSSDSIRVSSMGYLCPREEVLRARLKIDKIENQSAQTIRIFNIGTAYHTMVQNDYLGRHGYIWGNWKCLVCEHVVKDSYMPEKCPRCSRDRSTIIYEEFELKSQNFNITGHPDGIILIDGKKWLLELKTINDFGFKDVIARGQPKDDHILQSNMYMGMLKIYQALVVYFNKDSGAWRQFYIKYDNALVRSKLDSITYMRQCIDDPEKPLPARVLCANMTCSRAKNCPVSKQCFQAT